MHHCADSGGVQAGQKHKKHSNQFKLKKNNDILVKSNTKRNTIKRKEKEKEGEQEEQEDLEEREELDADNELSLNDEDQLFGETLISLFVMLRTIPFPSLLLSFSQTISGVHCGDRGWVILLDFFY